MSPTTGSQADELHRDAIVIDAVAPLANTHPHLLDWWIEGGTTAVAPTVGGFHGPAETLANLARWQRRIAADPRLRQVFSAADVESARRDGTLGIIFHFQNTKPVWDDLDLVTAFKALGVGIIQLAYNVRNPIGDGCDERTDSGLSSLGLALIDRLNEERVIVDCSHTGYRTTMDALERTTRPAVFSHSNAKALVPSPRNITDDQIKAAAATGGLIGTVGFPAFVSASNRATLDQFIDHTAYVADLVGTDHIAFGIDYYAGQWGVAPDDEATAMYDASIKSGRWTAAAYPPPPYYYPEGIETPRTLQNMTRRMLERGFLPEDIRKFLGENWVRVYREVWGE